MTTLYKITFGTEFDKDGNRIKFDNDTTMAFDSILEDVAQNMGGYSLTHHEGGYMHENGSLAIESSKTLEIYGNEDQLEFIEHTAKLLKKYLNQESVIVTTQAVQVRFI